jgi:hypothetical protein
MRLNLEISKAQMDSVKALMLRVGARDMKDLINSALSVMEWAVDETSSGNEIVALDAGMNSYRVLVTPPLQYVRHQRRKKQELDAVATKPVAQDAQPQSNVRELVGTK